jgi:hypothetical protein
VETQNGQWNVAAATSSTVVKEDERRRMREKQVAFDCKKKRILVVPSFLPIVVASHASSVCSTSLQATPVSLAKQEQEIVDEKEERSSVKCSSHLDSQGIDEVAKKKDFLSCRTQLKATSCVCHENLIHKSCHRHNTVRKSSSPSSLMMMMSHLTEGEDDSSSCEDDLKRKQSQTRDDIAVFDTKSPEDDEAIEDFQEKTECRKCFNIKAERSTCSSSENSSNQSQHQLVSRIHGSLFQSEALRQSLIQFLKSPSFGTRSNDHWTTASRENNFHSSDLGSPSPEQHSNTMRPSTSTLESSVDDEITGAMSDDVTTTHDSDSDDDTVDNDFQELYFPDELILRELTEMRFLLKTLLEQNLELARITSPFTADIDILTTILGLTATGSTSKPIGNNNSIVQGRAAGLLLDSASSGDSNQATSSSSQGRQTSIR